MKKKLFYTIIILLFSIANPSFCRSKLRKSEAKKPRLEVSRVKKSKRLYYISSNSLEEDPIFKTFDKEFFSNTMLPDEIVYRYDKTKSVTKKELDKKLENLVREVRWRKRNYRDFIVLKEEDFSRAHRCGLLILKFKKYPFVVKLFIESPKTFVKPYSKGLYPALIFNANGGLGRFYLGFTRIKNIHNIRKKISSDPKWSQRIEFPRKWHWVPKDPKEIRIIGKNFRKNGQDLETIIPGIYCIVADEIKLKDKTFSLFDKQAREECMSLCNFLDVCLDPHIDNFLLEEGSNKIVLIDTENFRSLIGLKGEYRFGGYVDWIYRLAKKIIPDLFMKTKYKKR